MATSGSAERGAHIWNPKAGGREPAKEFVQVSVIARDLVTADIWATAAFAEGERAVEHLNRIDDVEALFIYADGELAATNGFVNLFAK
jgi:thiamine biosynthesis lipoprotein